MSGIATMQLRTEVIFGSGCAEGVGEVAKRLGAQRVLVISDRGLQKAGLVEAVMRWLAQAGLTVESFVDVEAEPPLESVAPGVEAARRAGAEVIVGLGGGSAMDVTKAVAMLLTNEGTLGDYLGTGLVKHAAVPMIMLPTTAGTGSELTPNALFYVPERRAKEAVVSPLITATVAMIDPQFTRSLPAGVTAASGMDALCHAVEAYTGLNANPLTEPYALESIRLITTHLRRAVFSGGDLAAREGMALGSLYAAVALATAGTNGVHALAYPLQGLNRITHGVANSLLLPYVMAYNVPASLERFARVAQQMGQPAGDLSLRQLAEAGVSECRSLAADVGIPRRLREVGITADQIPALVAGAMQVTRLIKNNPRPLQAADVESLLRTAL
jgi:alcohol dehydrogenase class IV